MVRRANISEFREVAIACKEFEKETSFVKVDPDVCVKNYTKIVLNGTGVLFVKLVDNKIVGALGAVEYFDFHCGRKMAVETVWFIQPEHRGSGVELFNALEDWAREKQCAWVVMVHLHDSMPKTVERFYRSKGYKLMESHYMKEL